MSTSTSERSEEGGRKEAGRVQRTVIKRTPLEVGLCK